MKFKDKLRRFFNKTTIGLVLAASPVEAHAPQATPSSKDPVPDAQEIIMDNPHEDIVQDLPEQVFSDEDSMDSDIWVTYNDGDWSGYNITYNMGTFMFSDEKGQGFSINEKELNLEDRYEELKHVRDSVFASPVKVSLMTDVAEGDLEIKAQYLIGQNQIIVNPNVNLDAMISVLEEKGIATTSQLSAEEAAAQRAAYNDVLMPSIQVHENSHRDMDSLGVNDAFVNMYDRGRLYMMDEIRSNVAEAGFALQYYKTTGRT